VGAFKLKSRFRKKGNSEDDGKASKIEDAEEKDEADESHVTPNVNRLTEQDCVRDCQNTTSQGNAGGAATTEVSSAVHSIENNVMRAPNDTYTKEGDASGSGSGSGSGDESGKRHKKEQLVRSLDPEDYLYAKKQLKKAVLEHYR